MTMQRWALVRNGAVREYLLSEGQPTVEAFNMRAWAFPDAVREDGARVEDEGDWVQVSDPAMLVTTGWTYAGGKFLPPVTKTGDA